VKKSEAGLAAAQHRQVAQVRAAAPNAPERTHDPVQCSKRADRRLARKAKEAQKLRPAWSNPEAGLRRQRPRHDSGSKRQEDA
jgi:hypothetical protein